MAKVQYTLYTVLIINVHIKGLEHIIHNVNTSTTIYSEFSCHT